jgi:hypothetical protein
MAVYLLKLLGQKGTDLSSSTFKACTDLFATATQLYRERLFYLGPPCAILWLLSLFCIIGIIVSIYVRGPKGVCGFICKFLHWTTYTLPRWIFHGISLGMELVVIHYLNVTAFLTFACFEWLCTLVSRTHRTMKIMDYRVVGFLSSIACLHWIMNTLVSALTTILVTHAHWKQQGYGIAFRILVLLPGLVFAMTVSLVMYILVFLPVVCLSQIWDFYFAERIEELHGGNCPQGTVCKFESIPELDLNDEGDESGENGKMEQMPKVESNLWLTSLLRKDSTLQVEPDAIRS